MTHKFQSWDSVPLETMSDIKHRRTDFSSWQSGRVQVFRLYIRATRFQAAQNVSFHQSINRSQTAMSTQSYTKTWFSAKGALNRPSVTAARAASEMGTASTGTSAKHSPFKRAEFGSQIRMAVSALCIAAGIATASPVFAGTETRITEHGRYFGCSAGRLTSW